MAKHTTNQATSTNTKAAQAQQLADLQAQLASMAAANQALQTQLLAVGTVAHNTQRTQLPTWQGYSCIALIRAMYHLGFAPGTTNRALVAMGIVCSPATISTQRQHAKKGQAGAPLTPAQATAVRAIGNGQPYDQAMATLQAAPANGTPASPIVLQPAN